MNVARNVMLDPRLVPGGGAAEMALAHVSTMSIFELILNGSLASYAFFLQ